MNLGIMRISFVFFIFLLITACGMKKEKSGQDEKSPESEELVKEEYLQKGTEIANITQAELLKNVAQAMKSGGPEFAIEFCHMRAMTLKDSLSNVNQCKIRRIAGKYRNPLDKPRTQTEIDQLSMYKSAHQKGDTLFPEVILFDDRVEYYKPILINNGACLVCHGSPGTQIADVTLEKISALYPNDLATGFGMNDFRGAWQITFKR